MRSALLFIEPDFLHSQILLFKDLSDYEILHYQTLDQALHAMAGTQIVVDIVCVDMKNQSSASLISAVRDVFPLKPVIALLHEEAHMLISLNAGADDIILHPLNAMRLRHTLERNMNIANLRSEVSYLQHRLENPLAMADILASGPTMRNTCMLAQHAAVTDNPVIIEGETGVGKSLFARVIHGCSKRRSGALVQFFCRRLDGADIDTILFDGSDSAANGMEKSVLRQAEAGTLVLEDIDNLPLKSQSKLLDILQHGLPDANGRLKPFNVRLICSSRHSLEALVKDGKFNASLHGMLKTFPLHVPALRHRREDVPQLAEHFLKRHAISENRPARSLSSDAMAYLSRLPWAGNVRQLDHVMWRAVMMCEHKVLGIEHLEMRKNIDAAAGQPIRATVRNAFAAYNPSSTEQSQDVLPLFNEQGKLKHLAQVESEAIRFALRRYNSHMSEVAKRLGIGRSTLYRKVQEMGLDESQNTARHNIEISRKSATS